MQGLNLDITHDAADSLIGPVNGDGAELAGEVDQPRRGRVAPIVNAHEFNRLTVLVTIANHGLKNQYFLEQLLAEYRSMDRYEVDIVVLSDIPKNLGPDVEVKVGLPIKDPWSLPFGHKELFATRLEKYDLFVYTEDDTLVTQRNIDAFVEATRILPDKFIAGFMRYEVSDNGQKFYSSMHSHYHWDPSSVVKIGNSVYAYHTNEHAACFILTRGQLRKAIASGGFLLPPRKDRYDMLVTAATDPYTSCGFKKLLCISRFDDFCLHHLPNVYCGKLGLESELGRLEMDRLIQLEKQGDVRARRPLFQPSPLRDGDPRNKNYYENRREDVLERVPRDARRILSVGCGCGTTEAELVKRGITVVGIPLDSIIQTTAIGKGITMLAPDFDLAAKQLEGSRFDCILMLDILQHLPDPLATIRHYHRFLRDGGTIIISAPNWNYKGTLGMRLTSQGREYLDRRSSPRDAAVHPTTKACLSRWLRQSGFRRMRHCGVTGRRLEKLSRWTLGIADELLCRNLLITALR